MSDPWRYACPECDCRNVRTYVSQPGWYCPVCRACLLELIDLKADARLSATLEPDTGPVDGTLPIPHPRRKQSHERV